MHHLRGGKDMLNNIRYQKDISSNRLPKKVIITNLYDLVKAIREEVKPEEKMLIPQITKTLLFNCKSNCTIQ